MPSDLFLESDVLITFDLRSRFSFYTQVFFFFFFLRILASSPTD